MSDKPTLLGFPDGNVTGNPRPVSLSQLSAAMLQVQDKDLVTAPVSPINDSHWVVAGTGGAWRWAAVNDIASYSGGGWTFRHPASGDLVWMVDEAAPYIWTGSAWTIFPFDVPTNAEFLAVHAAMSEPTGFVDITESSISFNDGTREFTIEPVGASFTVCYYGAITTKTDPEVVQIDDVEGLHYIYYDAAGALRHSTDVWNLAIHVPVAQVYWNADSSTHLILAEERHGCVMDWRTHLYLHLLLHTQYDSGLTLSDFTVVGDGSSDTHVQASMSEGRIFDEDLFHSIYDGVPDGAFTQTLTPTLTVPIAHLSGADGALRIIGTTDLLVPTTGTGRAAFNKFDAGEWGLAEVTDTYHVAVWLIGSSNREAPIIAILGQREDDTLNNAQINNDETAFALGGLAGQLESRLLYRLIFQTNNTYTNSVKSRLVDVADLRRLLRPAQSSFSPTLHSSLSDIATSGHPASVITATDAGNYYATGTVQGQLQELGAATPVNAGAAGEGVFRSRTALVDSFKKIKAGSTKITVVGAADSVDLDVDQTKLDHGSLDATSLTHDDHTIYSKADGTRAFTGVVAGVDPTLDPHLSTKKYVDDGLALKSNTGHNHDHGTLTGLGDDDHIIYSKADGTRAFTGVVGGVTPTLDPHLSTKKYVDDGLALKSNIGHNHDHGTLTGLGDDDHIIYSKADGTRAFTGAVSGISATLAAHLTTLADVHTEVYAWQDVAINKTNTPPVGPSEHDVYLINGAPTGAWAGHSNEVAVWANAVWVFITPETGWHLFNQTDGRRYVFDGVAWSTESKTTVAASAPLLPQAGDRFYNTGTNRWYYYDSSRSVWLSDEVVVLPFGDDANVAAGSYLDLASVTDPNAGYEMLENMILVGYSWTQTNAGATASTARIRQTGVTNYYSITDVGATGATVGRSSAVNQLLTRANGPVKVYIDTSNSLQNLSFLLHLKYTL